MGNNLTVSESVSLLKKYSYNSVVKIDSPTERQQLRQSLLLVTNLSEGENIGICADNEAEGLIALETYLQAFGYNSHLQSYNFQDIRNEKSNSAIYIKFNTQKLSYYLDSYLGEYRGVLVSIQGEDDKIAGMYGYFPLDLFTI